MNDVKELAQLEKEERKARRKTRMLWVLIGLDILLLVYALIEIVMLIVSLI